MQPNAFTRCVDPGVPGMLLDKTVNVCQNKELPCIDVVRETKPLNYICVWKRTSLH